MKADVKKHIRLPEKNEQVLFCRLTEEQRSLYRAYIDGQETKSILSGHLKVFVGLIALRQICNHADLHSGGPKIDSTEVSRLEPEDKFGWYKRSGKMIVDKRGHGSMWHRTVRHERRHVTWTRGRRWERELRRRWRPCETD